MNSFQDKNKDILEPQIEELQINASPIIYRRFSDIKCIPITWLWKYRIARGKLTIIAGDPGLGKSQLSTNITTIVTTGGIWPVDKTKCTQGCVVLLSAEDDPEDTIRPRLEAAGAKLNSVFIIDVVQEDKKNSMRRHFNLKADIERLGKMLTDLIKQGVLISLVIIDPITAYLGNIDSHKNADVRSLLIPLTELAAKFQFAIIGITHLSKNERLDALMRVNGSLAFVAAARAVYLVARDDEDKDKLLFIPMKNNIGNDKTGFSFTIESCQLTNGIETSKITWSNEIVIKTADDVMSYHGQDNKTAKKEAEEFLRDLLASEEKSVGEIKNQAENAGHNWAAIRRAKNSLRIISEKSGMQSGWTWKLP